MSATRIVGIIGLVCLAYVVIPPFLIHDYVFAYALPDGQQTPLTMLLGLAYIFAVWGALIAACIFLISWAGRGFTQVDGTQAQEPATGVVDLHTARQARIEQRAS